jgi:hypothetical protein
MKTLSPHVFFVLLILALSNQVMAQKGDYMPVLREHIVASNNKIIVLNIWNTKFPDEIVRLNELKEKYKNDDVVFLAITDEDKNEVHEFLETHPFSYDQLIGLEGEKIFNLFQTGMYKVYPMHIIIDQSGKVSFKRKNLVKNIETKLAKKIDLLLDNNYDGNLRNSSSEYTFNKSVDKDINP